MGVELGAADYAVMLAYLGAILALGLMIGRRMHTGSDYFLAGRALPWWAIGMSLVATDIGGTDIVGVGGAAYRHGLAVANFEWIGCVPAMIVAAFVFVPFFWRAGVYTIPEYMERRYNVGVRTALALCWLAFMACNLGIMLHVSADMMSTYFGWNYTWSLWISAGLVGLYTFAGGLAAVVYTDTIQCAVMIGGCLLVLVIGLADVGGIGGLKEALRQQAQQEQTAGKGEPPADRTALIVPVDTEGPFPWSGIFFGLGLVLAPAYWIGNQAIVQRTLGARSEFEVKAAYIWGALLKNVVPLVIAVPGLIAMVKFPELADGDRAFPALVGALLPTGLRGLFLAAFMAAMMSSVDSYLNSAATIFTNDLYRRFIRPNATNTHLLFVGRATTVAIVAWAAYFALRVSKMEGSGIYTIFQTLMAFFQGPALALLLTGVLWRRATGTAALVGFLAGIACSVSLFTLNQKPVYSALELEPLFQISDPYLYFSVWAFLTALVLIVVVSLMTRPEPKEKLEGLVYRRAVKG